MSNKPSGEGAPTRQLSPIPSASTPPDSDSDRGTEIEQLLAQLLSEMDEKTRAGHDVDLQAICAANPLLANELQELWGAIVLANFAGSHAHESARQIVPPPTNEPGFKLPHRFGDYELLAELGRGGMGIVYQARQISLDRAVAVKMIVRGNLATPSDHLRFQAEATATARLDHAGIVPVYEVGEWHDRPFFSMKLVAGTTLAARLADGPLPARESARILAAVCDAVDYAHRQGVLHRDLKPSNILLDEFDRPLITDFGLAKQMGDAVSLTNTGAVLGTPSYMAPEQAAGAAAEIGPASDVYSLGTILYHMLTGRPPFLAATPLEIIFLVLEQEPLPPRALNPKADRDLELIALRCLQKPADLRYPSAAALGADLMAWMNDEPISARTGRFAHIVAGLLRETHHAVVLENWGLLWMWHSLVLLVLCLMTEALYAWEVRNRFSYAILWTAGLGAWASVFWAIRRRQGPVLFVERQIAHIWAASMIGIALLFPLEAWLQLDVLRLSPVLGIIAGMAFLAKAGILSGGFYLQAAALFFTAALMAWWPQYAHLIFGVVSAACFFFPGLKYYRRRKRSQRMG